MIVVCILVDDVRLNFYTMLDEARTRLLLNQCKICNYHCVSLYNEMRDVPLVCMSPILEKGDARIRWRISH
jgi:hypothetical protein